MHKYGFTYEEAIKVYYDEARESEPIEKKEMARRRNRNKFNKQKSNNMHIVKPSVDSRLGKQKIYVVGSNKKSGEWTNMQLVNSIEEADLVMFTGGEDINPALYGQNIGTHTHYNQNRDDAEVSAYKEAVELGKKMIGICRGGQLLTALNGGKLIQHVNGHGISHKMTLCWRGKNEVIEITSSHHQMFYPYDMEPGSFRIFGWSTEKNSTIYLDGDNNPVKLPKNFREPEIVLYTDTHSLCIQGHPEWLDYYHKTNKELRDMLVTFMEIKEFKKVNYEAV